MSRARAIAAAGIAVAFVVGGLAVEWAVDDGTFGLDVRIDLIAGWVLALAGLVGWVTVPGSRVGPLLIASAGAWFLGTMASARVVPGSADLPHLPAFLIQTHAGFLVQAVVTWPSGRVTRPTQLIVVVGGWIAALFPRLWYEDPGYLVLGGLLGLGVLIDQRTLSPARRAAYRPARNAALALAAGLVCIPGLARALRHVDDWMMLAAGTRLWAILVGVVALVLVSALVERTRRGRAADVAVRLREEDGRGMSAGLEQQAQVREAIGSEVDDEPEVRQALARAASLATRNQELRVTLAGHVAEMEASRRRLVEVSDEERRALVERLRTGAGARLDALEIAIRAQLADGVPNPGAHDIGRRLARTADQLALSRAELRALSLGLDPGRVAERGLEGALRELAAGSPVRVELSMSHARTPGPSVAATLYFVASEALANVVRHARAGTAWLHVLSDAGGWSLSVDDDGIGGADPAAGSGLRGLRERVETLGGALEVGVRPGGGTRIQVTIPTTSTGGPA